MNVGFVMNQKFIHILAIIPSLNASELSSVKGLYIPSDSPYQQIISLVISLKSE